MKANQSVREDAPQTADSSGASTIVPVEKNSNEEVMAKDMAVVPSKGSTVDGKGFEQPGIHQFDASGDLLVQQVVQVRAHEADSDSSAALEPYSKAPPPAMENAKGFEQQGLHQFDASGDLLVQQVVQVRASAPESEAPAPQPPPAVDTHRSTVAHHPGAYLGAPGKEPRRLAKPRFSSLQRQQADAVTTKMQEYDSKQSLGSSWFLPRLQDSSSRCDREDEESLAIANMVEERRISSYPRAKPLHDSVTTDNERSGRTCTPKTGFFVSIGFLGLLCLLVVLVFVVRDPSSEHKSSAPMPLQNNSCFSLEERIQNLLPEHSVEATKDLHSAQAKAYDWLLKDPSVESFPAWRIQQRFALASFYYATDGDTWKNNTGWLNYDDDVHECYWHAFGHDEALRFRDALVATGRYVNFRLEDLSHDNACENGDAYQHFWPPQNLRGTLPPELSLLTSLRSVWFQNNPDLFGSPFSFLGKLTSLQSITMLGDRSLGVISSEIGNLRNLTFLVMSVNGLSGSLPSEIGQLTQLSILSLGRNVSFCIRGYNLYSDSFG